MATLPFPSRRTGNKALGYSVVIRQALTQTSYLLDFGTNHSMPGVGFWSGSVELEAGDRVTVTRRIDGGSWYIEGLLLNEGDVGENLVGGDSPGPRSSFFVVGAPASWSGAGTTGTSSGGSGSQPEVAPTPGQEVPTTITSDGGEAIPSTVGDAINLLMGRIVALEAEVGIQVPTATSTMTTMLVQN